MEQWIKERDNYDDIKKLIFFTKFRKWKTLKMWKKNVTKHKTSVCKKLLEDKLFLIHPVLVKNINKFKLILRVKLYLVKDNILVIWRN